MPKRDALAALIAELIAYDICVLSGFEVILLPYLRTKTIYRATGSDLTVFPVLSYRQFFQLRPDGKVLFWRHPWGVFRQVINFYLRRHHFRQAIQAASCIDGGLGKPFQIALKKLGGRANRPVSMFSLAIDTELFARDAAKARAAALRWGLHAYRFIAFMPSRMMMKHTDVHIETGQWKASDVAIRAYKSFVDSMNAEEKSHVILLIPDRTLSDDLKLAKALVHELGIDANVRYIKGDSETGLARHELIQLYSLSDVVLDDFGAGWYGSLVVEALSCSCPVITYVPDSVMDIFPWHPIQNAQTQEEIAASLRFLYDHPSEKERLRAQSRCWVEEFHSQAAVSKKLGNALKSLVGVD
jgi:glycosyltransferase involved in cell wall biosynthesis